MNFDGFIEDEAAQFDNLGMEKLNELRTACSSADFQKLVLNEPRKVPTLNESLRIVGLKPTFHPMAKEVDVEQLRQCLADVNHQVTPSYHKGHGDPNKEYTRVDANWINDHNQHVEAGWGFGFHGQLIWFSHMKK